MPRKGCVRSWRSDRRAGPHKLPVTSCMHGKAWMAGTNLDKPGHDIQICAAVAS
jgi:hypothetical protein